jgi:2-dehydro-3-deoxy-D-arabinonate dehydratase
MKLIQFFLPGKGKRVGLVRGDRVLDITSSEEGVRTTLDLVAQGKTAQGVMARASWLAKRLHRRELDWRELQRPPSRRVAHLLVPIDAPEVWGTKEAYTWKPGSSGSGQTPDDSNHRPALFFKATCHRVAGPHAPVAIRHDSAFTVPEPSLAVVLGSGGAVIGFTACNDLTARDIEQEGLEYQSQARVYLGNCALGPCFVTSDEIDDAHAVQMRCSILRSGEVIFSEAAGSPLPQRLIEISAGWLCRDNPVPPGSVLCAGPAIGVPESAALREGDRVDIEAESIGRLSNPVRQWKGSSAS